MTNEQDVQQAVTEYETSAPVPTESEKHLAQLRFKQRIKKKRMLQRVTKCKRAT